MACLAASATLHAAAPIDARVRSGVLPQFEYFFDKLAAEGEHSTLDGVRLFDGRDKFLPGKIAIGMSYLLLDDGADGVKREKFLRGYREIADLTVGMDNETWGIYYYLLALHRLKRAGFLDRAVAAETLAQLRGELDWRTFVTAGDYRLIDLPSNYYGVAFSVARLRFLLGWEDESASKALLEKMLAHYAKYSGGYGFSDETEGEGRFDRYSILLAAEVSERYIETGLEVTPQLQQLLRNSVKIAFDVGRANGEGFSFGRSIGPYGDTAILEILSAAARLGLLDSDQKAHAYAYSARIVERYLAFWYDPALRSVDMWGKGRRTDAYRGKHRILGENLSLLHQLASAAQLWKQAGYAGVVPADDLDTWMKKTQPAFALHWFARGTQDRALAVVRDGDRVFSLLMVNGGTGQHDNSPYYTLPFANDIIAGVADSGARHAQLLPKLLLRDGTELIPAAFIKDIQTASRDGIRTVSFRQDALDRLGRKSPIEDGRIQVETRYAFAPGTITRIDRYTASAPVEVERMTLEFASFSTAPTGRGSKVDFAHGAIESLEARGFDGCRARSLGDEEAFRSPTGAMHSLVECERAGFLLQGPLEVEWTIRYRQGGDKK